jgi:CRISPR-associated endoribonuclease Cas6
LRILEYRGTVIKGWTGLFKLDLPEPFFLLAYDSGLGSKNSQGFGMVEVVDGPEA